VGPEGTQTETQYIPTPGLRLQAIADGRKGRAETPTPEAPLRAHATLDNGTQCEEMGGSLCYGSSHCNEIQAPLKSTVKVTDSSYKDFCLKQCVE